MAGRQPAKNKDKAKQTPASNGKGSDQLREFFLKMGQSYQELDDGPVKEWVGSLLVTAHRLDERCVELTEETWLNQLDEKERLALEQQVLDARQQARRYRAQKINARRDFIQVRLERDLMRAKYDELMGMLSQGVQLVIQQEAEKTIAARAAVEAADGAS